MAAFRSSDYDDSGPAPDQSSPRNATIDNLAAHLQEFRAGRPSRAPQTAPADSQLADPAASTIRPMHAPVSGSAAKWPGAPVESPLSARQLELLRHLAHSEALIPECSLDARVLGALVRKGLAEILPSGVQASGAGHEHFRTKVRKRRRVGHHRAAVTDREERADIILQAVRDLEQALPDTRLMAVGDLSSDVPELLAGLRAFADEVRLGAARVST